jgi:predicted Co/Zn/Cd cation transporter (cation efflux family)
MLGQSYYEPIDIPFLIPYTPIPIFGTVLVALYLILLISAEKKILKRKPQITLLALTLAGVVIITSCEFVYQLVRLLTFDLETLSDYFYQFSKSFLGSSFFGSAIAFLIAFQLKTKKTGVLILFIVGFILLVKLFTIIFN